MAGIIDENVMPRLFSARTHAVIDYIHAGTNIAMGFALRRRDRKASNAAFAVGAGILANAFMTDYPGGVFRLYDFKVHGVMDYGVAALCTAMPEIIHPRRTGSSAFFRSEGIGEFGIAATTDYSDTTGSTRAKRRLREFPSRWRVRRAA
jgi:hypothetical protein